MEALSALCLSSMFPQLIDSLNSHTHALKAASILTLKHMVELIIWISGKLHATYIVESGYMLFLAY